MRGGWFLVWVWFWVGFVGGVSAEEKGIKSIEEQPVPQKHSADQNAGEHHIFNFSLYYPVSLNTSEFDTTNLNISLLYSKVGAVKGFDLSLGVSGVHTQLKGIQIAGLIGAVGESLQGAQIAGLISVAGNRINGLQLAGLISVSGNEYQGVQASGLIGVSGHSAYGLQLAGLIAVSGKSFWGLQIAPVLNVTGDDLIGSQIALVGNVTGRQARGFQIAPVMNVAGSRLDGFQIGGLMNVTGGELNGFQIGGYNRVGQLNGFQLGLYNQADSVAGFQIGLVNVLQDGSGIPIGIVNLSETQGRIRLTAFGGSIMAINTGVRFEIDPIYSVVYLGALNLYDDQNRSFAYGFRYGAHLPIDFGQSGQSLSWEVGYQFIDNQDFLDSSPTKPDQQVVSFRGVYTLDLTEWISVFAGVGLSYVWDHYDLQHGKIKPALDVGVILL